MNKSRNKSGQKAAKKTSSSKNADDVKTYLAHIVKNLPKQPGIYKFKDAPGKIIYIGKAKNLRHRVSSYFQSSKQQSTKNRKMIEQIADIDYSVVASELEAIMLETNMIKEHRPKYNILMKDDKNYVYIKITTQEDFPRIIITRTVEKDGARYFGPKTAQHKVKKTLKVLKRIFPYRHCSLNIEYQGTKDTARKKTERKHKVKVTKAGIKYPCIDYHIKRCIAPCIGTVSPKEYQEIIDQVIRFLEGKHEEIIAKLKSDMAKAASERKFEVAAKIRDKLQAIEDIMEPQRISTPRHENSDIINYVLQEEQAFFNLSQIRNGKLINQENFEVLASEDQTTETLEAFLKNYYDTATDIPQEVIIPHDIQDQQAIEAWLKKITHRSIHISVPQKGRKDKLLELCLENATSFARLSKTKWQGHQKSGRGQALQHLQEVLNLPTPPKRLECYDISHLSGTNTVASMVVFQNGFPKKGDYRKFKLHQQTPGKPDDFASMHEALSRRLKYLRSSKKSDALKLIKPSKKEIAALKISPNKVTLKNKDLPKEWLLYKLTTADKKTTIATFQFLATNDKPAKILLQQVIPPPKTANFSLHQQPPQDLQNLLKIVAQKVKTKRLYLQVPTEYQEAYEKAGCTPIRQIPQNFPKLTAKNDTTQTYLVFDLNKQHTDNSFKQKPDLIVIDGGKGQLSSAYKAMKSHNLDLPIISIAKKQEEIFIPGKSKPILLPHDSQTLHLIQHIRDESHRFAVSYQQNLHLKSSTSSELDSIPGIGPSTKQKLFKHFGSVQALHEATLYELEQIVGKKAAMKVKTGLQQPSQK